MRRGVCALVTAVLLTTVLPSAEAAAAAPALVPKPICCVPNSPIHAIAIDGTTAYVGGEFRHLGQPALRVALLDPVTGQPRPGWPGANGTVDAAASDGSGGWYIGGVFTTVGSVPRGGLAHILANGSVDPAWAPTIDNGGTVVAMTVLNSTVYVGGLFDTVNGGTPRKSLAAFDATTGAVTAFTADVSGGQIVWALKAHSGSTFGSSRLYVGGSFDHVGGTPRHNLASINLDTGALVGTDPEVGGFVFALAVTNPPTGTPTVYAGGSFTSIGSGSTPRGRVAAFTDGAGAPTAFNPDISDGEVDALALSGSTLYAGGTFSGVGSPAVGRSRLAAFDRTSGALTTWNPSADAGGVFKSAVRQLAVLGGTVYASGSFSQFTAPGPAPRTNLAAFDATSGNALDWDPEAGGSYGVHALDTDGAGVLVGGNFRAIGGEPRDHVAAIDLTTGELTPFNPRVDGVVNALGILGGTIYVGGDFKHAGGSTSRRRLAAFNRATGSVTPFDPDIKSITTDTGRVEAIHIIGDTVFAGGQFEVAHGAERDSIAAFDGQTGDLRRFQNDIQGTVYALAAAGSTLFTGGSFFQADSKNRSNLASFDLAASSKGVLSSFDPAPENTVDALALDGATLYAGGVFGAVFGTIPRQRLAAFDTVTGTATGWDPAADGRVRALTVAQHTVFAGGEFTHAHGTPRAGLAALEPDGSLAGWNPAANWTPTATGTVFALASSPDGGLVAGGDGILFAFALRPGAPAAPVATAGNGSATVSFGSAPNGGATPAYTVTSSPGGITATGSGSPVTVPGLTNGTTYTFTVTATNAAGSGPPSPASNAIKPSAPPAGGPGTDKTPPLVTGFRLTNKRFAPGKGSTALTARARRAKRGTVFVFALSEKAGTKISIARKLPGRKKGKRCVAPRKQLQKKCTRYVPAGTLTRSGTKLGLNKVAFTGRLGKRALRPGGYRATLIATDPAGNRSKPATAAFTVVPR